MLKSKTTTYEDCHAFIARGENRYIWIDVSKAVPQLQKEINLRKAVASPGVLATAQTLYDSGMVALAPMSAAQAITQGLTKPAFEARLHARGMKITSLPIWLPDKLTKGAQVTDTANAGSNSSMGASTPKSEP